MSIHHGIPVEEDLNMNSMGSFHRRCVFTYYFTEYVLSDPILLDRSYSTQKPLWDIPSHIKTPAYGNKTTLVVSKF